MSDKNVSKNDSEPSQYNFKNKILISKINLTGIKGALGLNYIS